MRSEKLGYKIREAQMQKVPYMLVIGDKEVEKKAIAPRKRDGKQMSLMTPPQFAELVERNASSPARGVLVWALFEHRARRFYGRKK